MSHSGAVIHDADLTGDDHDGHAPDDHDHGDEHGPVEKPGWVLVPLAIGLVIGLILVFVFGLESGASAFG